MKGYKGAGESSWRRTARHQEQGAPANPACLLDLIGELITGYPSPTWVSLGCCRPQITAVCGWCLDLGFASDGSCPVSLVLGARTCTLQVLMVRAQTQAAVCKISAKMKIKAVLGHPLSCLVEFRLPVAAQVAWFHVLVALAYESWCAFGCSLTHSHPGDKISERKRR